ncbi:hypothetical protein [Pyrobaculum ferrireducens]|uniref:hypothetical protein n=1 Tax=Pyrobaculum ferrireducens TaxID=1104324 RepID=UPI0011E5558F|nr:hypothetical protein [Pyrobaculum ferrireducens]
MWSRSVGARDKQTTLGADRRGKNSAEARYEAPPHTLQVCATASRTAEHSREKTPAKTVAQSWRHSAGLIRQGTSLLTMHHVDARPTACGMIPRPKY